MKETNWFKTKKVVASFAIIALIAGFFFLNKKITGNVILNAQHAFSLISLIGLLLVACAIILGAYTIRKK